MLNESSYESLDTTLCEMFDAYLKEDVVMGMEFLENVRDTFCGYEEYRKKFTQKLQEEER